MAGPIPGSSPGTAMTVEGELRIKSLENIP